MIAGQVMLFGMIFEPSYPTLGGVESLPERGNKKTPGKRKTQRNHMIPGLRIGHNLTNGLCRLIKQALDPESLRHHGAGLHRRMVQP